MHIIKIKLLCFAYGNSIFIENALSTQIKGNTNMRSKISLLHYTGSDSYFLPRVLRNNTVSTRSYDTYYYRCVKELLDASIL